MEILQSFTFQKPSTSRYAPVVEALLKTPTPIIRLKRGEDFPQEAKIESVQGALATQVRDSPQNTNGRRARTFTETDDSLVVTLWAEGEGPRRRAKRAATKSAARVTA